MTEDSIIAVVERLVQRVNDLEVKLDNLRVECKFNSVEPPELTPVEEDRAYQIPSGPGPIFKDAAEALAAIQAVVRGHEPPTTCSPAQKARCGRDGSCNGCKCG